MIDMYQGFIFAKEYFYNSEDRVKTCLLFLGASITTILLFALIASLSTWTSGFWAAIIAKDMVMLSHQMQVFIGLGLSILAVNYINDLCIKSLDACWYAWLSSQLIKSYTEKSKIQDNNFVDLHRFQSEVSNPQQRLVTDVNTFVKSTISLFFGVFGAVLRFAFSIRALWVIGGSLSFVVGGFNLTIPGFLVWISLISSGLFSLAVSFIGNKLTSLNKNQKLKTAELQQELDLLEHNAESIAQEKGEKYYQRVLLSKIEQLKKIRDEKVWLESKVAAFKEIKHRVMSVLPALSAIPLVFSGVLDVALLMQVGFLFDQVSSVFDVFIHKFEEFADFKASLQRLTEFQQSLSSNKLGANQKNIVRKYHSEKSIRLDELDVSYPKSSSTKQLFEKLNICFSPGEKVLLEGQNGAGKSTFLKVLAGSWPYGKGKVSLPKGTMFLPQSIQIPQSTLREILQYPNDQIVFSTKDMQSALNKVDLGYLSARLDEDKKDWNHSLSLGEKQKIGFARVLLNKPSVLCLDEATASLSEQSEACMYQQVLKELPATTILSIGHRPGIKKYHQKHLFFSRGGEGQPSKLRVNSTLDSEEENLFTL